VSCVTCGVRYLKVLSFDKSLPYTAYTSSNSRMTAASILTTAFATVFYTATQFTTTTLLYSLGAIHTVSMAYVRNSDFFLASNVVSTAFTFTIRMSVCPSVCLSHSSSTPKRFKMWKYFHTVRWSNVSSFLRPNQS